MQKLLTIKDLSQIPHTNILQNLLKFYLPVPTRTQNIHTVQLQAL